MASSAASVLYPQAQLLSSAHTKAPPMPFALRRLKASTTAGSWAPSRRLGSALGRAGCAADRHRLEGQDSVWHNEFK